MNVYNAGVVTAYGEAVHGGYTGTYEEFCAMLAGLVNDAERAETAAETAVASAESAEGYAEAAEASAEAAETAAASIDIATITTAQIDTITQ